jgi:transcriptional regulator with GAF, ATPase, and Fis domain
LSVWIAFCGDRAHELRTLLVDGLAALGVAVTDRTPRTSGPGIVVFDAASDETSALVATSSHSGDERVIAIATARAQLRAEGPWRLMDAGAADVLAWDDDGRWAAEVAARLERWEEVDGVLASSAVRDQLVGESPAWRSTLRQVIEVARFTSASVLLTGESGTGKELVAHLIHDLDVRPRKAKLVVVDCTTIVPTLSGSEFFGHERGSFTGAASARDGAFALADGGTLFLDEVGELPLPLQAELLRVVQEGSFKRVGSNQWRETSFRLVCATNRDLPDEIAAGHFRADLYYRIGGATFRLPPLRERLQDVPLFIGRFLAETLGRDEPPELDDATRDFLLAREYPGNVRDLRQLVARIGYRHVGPGPVTVGAVPEEERVAADERRDDWRDGGLESAVRRALADGATLKEIGAEAVETAVRLALAAEDGNVQRAARRLGVTPRALQLRRAASLARPAADRYLPELEGDGSPAAPD